MIERFEAWTGYFLLDPSMLLLALLVPLAMIAHRWRGAATVRFAPAEFLPTDVVSWRVRLLPLPRLLMALGLLVAVLALARPVERVPMPLETEGIDIVMVLDISSSMNADDMAQGETRLTVVQRAMTDFVDQRPDDRFGLVCFARYPDLRCPPTLDHDAFRAIADEVVTVESDSLEDATGIGTAVARAAQVLGGSDAKSKVVILLTDGEENVASSQTPDEIAPLHAGQLCAEMGVRVYSVTAGIGRRNASTGEWAPIDTTQVERLAERTGGRFFQAKDADSVNRVYEAIDALETAPFAEPRFELEERFLPFLVAAVLLLLIGRVLQATIFEVLP